MSNILGNSYPSYGSSNWIVPGSQQVQPGYGVLKSAPSSFSQASQMGPPTISDQLQGLISGVAKGNIDPSTAGIIGQLANYQQNQQFHDDRMALNREAIASQQLTPFQQGVQTFGNVMQGVGSLANIYMGLSSMREQKRNNALQREVINSNLNNSIADYNRRLEDRLRGRASYEGRGEEYVQSELARHSARRG